MLDIPKPLPEPIGACRFWHSGIPPLEPGTEKEKPKKRGKLP